MFLSLSQQNLSYILKDFELQTAYASISSLRLFQGVENKFKPWEKFGTRYKKMKMFDLSNFNFLPTAI